MEPTEELERDIDKLLMAHLPENITLRQYKEARLSVTQVLEDVWHGSGASYALHRPRKEDEEETT